MLDVAYVDRNLRRCQTFTRDSSLAKLASTLLSKRVTRRYLGPKRRADSSRSKKRTCEGWEEFTLGLEVLA